MRPAAEIEDLTYWEKAASLRDDQGRKDVEWVSGWRGWKRKILV